MRSSIGLWKDAVIVIFIGNSCWPIFSWQLMFLRSLFGPHFTTVPLVSTLYLPLSSVQSCSSTELRNTLTNLFALSLMLDCSWTQLDYWELSQLFIIATWPCKKLLTCLHKWFQPMVSAEHFADSIRMHEEGLILIEWEVHTSQGAWPHPLSCAQFL